MKAFALTAMAVLLLAGSAFAQCDDEFCVHCPKTPSKCGACLAGSNRVPLNGKCTCDIGAGFVEIDSECQCDFDAHFIEDPASNGTACICDYEAGWVSFGPGECICDTDAGYVLSDTDECICDSATGWVANLDGACEKAGGDKVAAAAIDILNNCDTKNCLECVIDSATQLPTKACEICQPGYKPDVAGECQKDTIPEAL